MDNNFESFNRSSDNFISGDDSPEIQRYLAMNIRELVTEGMLDDKNEISAEAIRDILQATHSLSDGELDIFIQDYESLNEKNPDSQGMTLDEARLASLYQEREKRQNVERASEGKETIEQIRENMWLLRKEGSGNPVSVVFRRGEKLLITDPGISWKSKEKNHDLHELEESLEGKVAGVMLTHSHPDHIGNIPKIADQKVPVYADKKAFWSLRSPGKLLKAENKLAQQSGVKNVFPDWQVDHIYPPYAKLMYGAGTKGIKKSSEEGGQYQEFPKEPMSFDGYSVEVINTPGHTRGEVCFWVPEEKILVGGDLIPNTHRGRDELASLYMPEANIYDAIDSLKIIKGLEPRMLIPTHGEPIRSASEIENRIEIMIAKLESFIQQVHDLRAGHPGISVEEMVEKIFKSDQYPKDSFGQIERKTIVGSVLRDEREIKKT